MMNRSEPTTRRVVILTSYLSQSRRGKLLGAPGYSYDIVARLFLPLLQRWGEVVSVPRDPGRIESAIREAQHRGMEPIHLSFLPFQDIHLTPSAPNVVFPFWEFPDVPAEAFDGNARNNWVATANRCDLVLVCGQFTVDAFQRAGIRTPIRIVPVPTPDEYFQLPSWSAKATTRLACPAYVFPNPEVPPHQLWDAPDAELHEDNVWPSRSATRSRIRGASAPLQSLKRELLGKLRGTYRSMMKPLIPPIIHEAMRQRVRPIGHDPWRSYLWSCRREELDLSGIVYTSIFSPHDGRKNWQDLLSGFVLALRERADATLVIKLVAKEQLTVEKVLNYYRTLGLAHRCKVVFLTDYLFAEQMLELAQASAYYLTTTRAEGCCLPLLNYLAAARPGIAPCHTAIGDYFGPEMGFVIHGSQERTIWPQDRRIRFKTTWHRLVWPSVIEQIRKSYELARDDAAGYDALAATARARMKQWVETESVWPRLREALDQLEARAHKRAATI
ncbi:MAG: glycosyltransferase [Gemmataceae bacterium]